MELLTDFPERISKKKKVYLGEGHIISKIITIHSSGVGLLVHLENIEKREEAQKLRNTVVYVRSDEIPNLPLGNFYHYQVMGMMVYKADKSRLGIIIDIISTGSNDVYVIRPDSGNEKEILLPAITSVILEINLEKRMMIVNLPNWG